MKAGKMKLHDKKYVHCAIFGDGMVGKTSISDCYSQKPFNEGYVATVFENYAVALNVAGEEFMVSMFDTAGQRDYESLRSFTYRESEVLLLCFSTCDRESFASITDMWIPELKRHSKLSKQKRPVILVGTQIDLRVGNDDREVTTDEGIQLAKDIGADCFIECSSRTHEGLKDVFEHVVFSALKYRKKKTNILKQIFNR